MQVTNNTSTVKQISKALTNSIRADQNDSIIFKTATKLNFNSWLEHDFRRLATFNLGCAQIDNIGITCSMSTGITS